MYVLEVHELTKRVGKTTLIDTVRLSVQPGELLALLGPPESGKTLLLRVLTGLEDANVGRILLNGEDITDTPATKRNISMVFQNGYGLIPHITASECISLPLQHMPMSKDGMDYRVATVAKTLNVSHTLERKISILSPGERLRVALARAIAKDPALYLFDELLEQLDTPSRLVARREIAELHQKLGFACIYATSDPDDAFAITNRVAVINQGKIQQIGTRSELIQTPATLWVAQWLGFPPMNTLTGYLQGTYQPEGICYRIWAKGFTPLLPMKWTRVIDIHQCKEIYVGIRPENIIPEWEFQARWQPTFYTLKTEVIASEWNQGRTLAQLHVPHLAEPLMALFDVSHEKVPVGSVFSIAVDPEEFRLFHPQTQQLLQAPSATSGWNTPTSAPSRRPLLSFLDRRRPGPGSGPLSSPGSSGPLS
ncbi:MAG TPA: ABC transporter ATP-binding protein [Ktedonobacteraceae bacterium]